MAYKVLGQSAPSAATNTDLYTVPSSKSAVVSTLAVCNRSAVATTYRVAVRPAGATLANIHYIVYDGNLPGAASDYLTLGITLATTDVVSVYAGAATLTFALFGDEA